MRGGLLRRRGFTLVEIMIVTLLFVAVMGAAADVYIHGVTAEKKVGAKLDLIQAGQIASLALGRELRCASEIFAPAAGMTETRPYVIFANEANELIVVYVNANHDLVRQNRTDNDKVQVLAHGVDRLRVFRKGHRQVNYHLVLKGPPTEGAGHEEKMSLISGVCIRNSFN